MKVIYLSSKMSGLAEEDWRANFDVEQFMIESCARINDEEVKVINPAEFDPQVNNPTWADYITDDITVLSDNATHIYMFGEWWTSLGSWVELLSAIRMEKEVIVSKGVVKQFLVKMLIKYFNKRCVYAERFKKEEKKG